MTVIVEEDLINTPPAHPDHPETDEKRVKINPKAPNQEPAQELPNRAAPRVEAHHHVNGPDTGRNSRGRRTIKKPFVLYLCIDYMLVFQLFDCGKLTLWLKFYYRRFGGG